MGRDGKREEIIAYGRDGMGSYGRYGADESADVWDGMGRERR